MRILSLVWFFLVWSCFFCFLILIVDVRGLEIQRVNSVRDGATIFVDLKNCENDIFCKNIAIQLSGIDVPTNEKKENREKAVAARNYLSEIINKAVYLELKNCDRDVLFRLNCEIRANGLSVSEIMISTGHARYYND